MKKSLVIVLVLSLIVGMTGLSSFAAVQNYQNSGMMGSNFARQGGMMGGNFAGRGSMMGSGNTQGAYNTSYINRFTGLNAGINAGVNSENAITLDEAYAIGKSYLEKDLSSEYTLDKDGIATGDYYTFFIDSNDKTAGRLSVNALTSEVWLHNCRGLLQ